MNAKALSPMILCATFALSMLPALASGEDFENNIEKTFAITPGGKLKIDVDLGLVNIKTEAQGKVEIQVFRKFKGGSKSDADKWFADHPVTVAQQGNAVSINQKTKKLINWSRGQDIEVRYLVNIPKKFDVDLSTAGGGIQVANLEGEAVTRTSSGQIKLAKISGHVSANDAGGSISLEEGGQDVQARTSSGSIQVHKVAGKIDASNAGGNIKIDESGGAVVAATSSGIVVIELAKGDVSAKSAGGSIKIGTVEGNLSAQTSSGSISVADAKGKTVDLRDAGGSIDVGSVAGDITAHTSSGAIRIKKAGGTVGASNSGGQIVIEEVTGDSVVQTSSGSILIGSAKGKLELKDAGGRIEVQSAGSIVTAETSSGDIIANFASAPKGECHLKTSGGGIKVGLLRSAAINIDARVAGGSVRVEPPLAVTVQGEQKHGELQGKINGGGPALVLRSSSGNIRIQEFVPEKLAAEDENGK